MAKFLIHGGSRLSGKVKVAGNKNSVFPLFAAALLGNSPTTLTNVPKIRDVEIFSQIISELGGKIENDGKGCVTIDPRGLKTHSINPMLAAKIRGSIVLAAPLLVRFGKVCFPRPGGDFVGLRPLNEHLNVFESFGARVNGEEMYEVQLTKFVPAKIFFEELSVTATEMAMVMASTMSQKSVIEGAAAEPHVVDLAEMLVKMGVKILGAGTNTIEIVGKKDLRGVNHRFRPDHIEVGTFAIASAITQGTVEIEDVRPEDLKPIMGYLLKMGVKANFVGKKLIVKPSVLKAQQKVFKTRPWPGFPTDLMSMFIVLATQTRGMVLCHDWMYEWRMFFVDRLIWMGANITIADPHRVLIVGPTKLQGELIPSPDIRAGGALVLAALTAEGKSEVEHAEVIDRGYEDFEGRLSLLGAKIKRVE